MSDKPKIKPARDVVIELQFENEALRAQVVRLQTPLPCGHPAACIVTADDLSGPGTQYCGWCADVVELELAAMREAALIRERDALRTLVPEPGLLRQLVAFANKAIVWDEADLQKAAEKARELSDRIDGAMK